MMKPGRLGQQVHLPTMIEGVGVAVQSFRPTNTTQGNSALVNYTNAGLYAGYSLRTAGADRASSAAVTYDFGVAKIGYTSIDATISGAKTTDSTYAISAPIGSGVSVGLTAGTLNVSTTKTTNTQTARAKAAATEPVTLNFVNAEIEAVARTVATLSGANVVVDPRVKGTMSLSSTLPVPPAQALRLFSAQLRTQGFALVENNGIHTVVPEADAKLQSGPVNAGNAPAGGGQIVTQIFRLNHESANNLVPVLRPLISPNNTINVNPGTNALVITDYGDNLQRLGRIIAALDVSNATGVEVIRLQHGIAADMASMVQRLIDSGAASGVAGATAATPGLTDSGFKTTMQSKGTDVIGLNSLAFAAFFKKDMQRWKRAVEASGAQVD